MTNKLKNSYKTISEVVKLLNLENPKKLNNQSHTIRYWETQFKQIKPIKINNRRYYDQKNVDTLLKIQYLLKINHIWNKLFKKNLKFFITCISMLLTYIFS